MTAQFFEVRDLASAGEISAYEALLIPVRPAGKKDDVALAKLLPDLPRDIAEAIDTYAKKTEFEPKEKEWLAFDMSPKLRIVTVCLPKSMAMFELLGLARKVLEPITQAKAKSVLVPLSALGDDQDAVADALVSAVVAGDFKFEKYGKKSGKDGKKDKKTAPRLILATSSDRVDSAGRRARQAEAVTEGTNRVRNLVTMAGNDLTCKRFRKQAEEFAAANGLVFDFINMDKLREMKAGAFVAVAQGSPHEDAGIVKLTYEPKGKGKKSETAQHLVLVGKGVTYDTGGINLKPAAYMYGMNGDMAGAAVAQALMAVASREAWPFRVTAFLAIADNAIGEKAYRPNDVVTSLKGTTIEIVHTDAEGRMILSDTLCLASKEKADLMLDFATLTGACVGAIGTSYAGAFTNRPEYADAIIAAGRNSGERVWPFPLDEDFGEALESTVADTKQCRLTGGVDHIEAAYFLKKFVSNKVPWVHVDISASEHEGGLAHVPSKETGFGVRFAASFALAMLGAQERDA